MQGVCGKHSRNTIAWNLCQELVYIIISRMELVPSHGWKLLHLDTIYTIKQCITIKTVINWRRSSCRNLTIRTTSARSCSISTISVLFTFLTSTVCHVVSSRAWCWKLIHCVNSVLIAVQLRQDYISKRRIFLPSCGVTQVHELLLRAYLTAEVSIHI